MRFKTLVLAGALATASWTVQAQEALLAAQAAFTAHPLGLAETRRLAAEADPSLRAKEAQLDAAEGLRSDAAGWLYNNPQLSLDGTRRDVPHAGLPSERRSEWSAGVSQTLEIAGQPGLRRTAAESGRVALRAEIDELSRRVQAQASRRFYRVLALQQRAAVEAEALKLFESTAAAVQKRRAAGEDTRLDANVAAVEAERARNQLALAHEQLLDARAELAAQLQLPPGHLPQADGDLADAAGAPYTLDGLLAQVDAQPRLRALSAREESARARLDLERASRYPDVTVGLSVGREGPNDGRERLTTLSVSVPLPLFKRNAAGIGQASTELRQATVERTAAARDLRADVHTLWLKLQSVRARAQRLHEAVLPALADNQQLSLKSQRAGQIGLLELIVVNRQALDARRDLIDALTDVHDTRLALELAAGWFGQE